MIYQLQTLLFCYFFPSAPLNAAEDHGLPQGLYATGTSIHLVHHHFRIVLEIFLHLKEKIMAGPSSWMA